MFVEAVVKGHFYLEIGTSTALRRAANAPFGQREEPKESLYVHHDR